MPASTQVQNRPFQDVAAYRAPLDAIVLAGTDRNPKRLIAGRNKSFLEIDGKVLVCHVVDALLGAATIGRIFVVGPEDQLREALGSRTEGITIVPQVGKMMANTWAGIHASEASCASGKDGQEPVRDRPMLFISSDLPLISPAAIDDFVSRCAREDSASGKPWSLLAGVAEEASVRPYYPDGGRPGIVRPYVHLNSGRMRLANIYVGRPYSLSHQEFLQTGFNYRKAKDWHNVLRLTRSFFGQSGGWYAAWLTLRLQVTLMASRRGGWLYRRLRRGNTTERIERGSGSVLGGTVRIIVTPYGGLSLDVDDEEDYHILALRFAEWLAVGPVPDKR